MKSTSNAKKTSSSPISRNGWTSFKGQSDHGYIKVAIDDLTCIVAAFQPPRQASSRSALSITTYLCPTMTNTSSRKTTYCSDARSNQRCRLSASRMCATRSATAVSTYPVSFAAHPAR